MLFRILLKIRNKIRLKLQIARKDTKCAKIFPEGTDGVKIAVFKSKTTESVKLVDVYNFFYNGNVDIETPEFALWKYNNVKISANSDILRTCTNKVVWPKYFKYNWNKNIPVDNNFVYEKNGYLYYRESKNIHKFNTCFSLIGVFSHIWAHAIVEYFPKLAVLEAAINDAKERITVLIPRYTDLQLKQIVLDKLQQYDVDIYEVNDQEELLVESLYYIDRPVFFTDHETNVALGDQLIPKETAEYVKNEIVQPRIEKIPTDDKYNKIFLPRRGGLGKGLINQEEVEGYFKSLGFYFVEAPHKLPLEEKIKIFKSANIIVGPVGSAFTNLIFCKPETKVLMLSNYQRIFEQYISMQYQVFNIDVLLVYGRDNKEELNPAHCSFSIPLDIIQDSYKKLLSNGV